MTFQKQTIRDIDIAGKRLLIRVDYSVDLTDKGEIIDDYKIRASLPTLHYALAKGASIVLVSHLGRPNGKKDAKLSLFPVAKRLQSLLGVDVEFVPAVTGERVDKVIQSLHPKQVVLLENLRFDAGEEANDEGFAKQLAAYGDIFVQDGFAVCYRRHASVDAITRQLPSAAGLLLEKEMIQLTSVLEEDTPLTELAIIGGDSVRQRAIVIAQAIKTVDAVVLVGKLSTVFLKIIGIEVGKTDVDDDDMPIAYQLMDLVRREKKRRDIVFYLPQDAVVAKVADRAAETRIVDWSAGVIADIEAYPRRPLHQASQVGSKEMILDIGPFTGAFIAGLVQYADSVVWVGTAGNTAVAGLRGPTGPFSHGSNLIAEALSGQFGRRPPVAVVAGDDAVNFITKRGLERAFSHVSTGGGASEEVLAGRGLLGVEVLMDKTMVN